MMLLIILFYPIIFLSSLAQKQKHILQCKTTQTKFSKCFLQNLIAEIFTLDELRNEQTTESDKNCQERMEANAYVVVSYSNYTKTVQLYGNLL